jgi:hypothetical protein
MMFSKNPSEMTISAIASFKTIIREVSVIVTVWSSADLTVTGSFDLVLPAIGNSNSVAEITIGRVVAELWVSEVAIIFELELAQDVVI